MEQLLSKLQAQARAHPSNPVLRRVLSEFRFLLNGAREFSPDVRLKYEELQQDLSKLATEGFWQPSQEDEESLRGLKKRLGLVHEDVRGTTPTSDGHTEDAQRKHTPKPSRDSSRPPSSHSRGDGHGGPIVRPPLVSTPLLPVSTSTPMVLPVELVQTLNHTLFLHLLATDPKRVLPPGKSLLSTMSAPRTNAQVDSELPKLEERVKNLLHTAFWKEALEALSSTSADKQLPRLKQLYEDLLTAIKSLLPKNHPLLATLALPLSPTSAPLRSALMHLREILVALRVRCSPVRDPQIDRLIRAVDEPNQLASTEELAQLVADTARSILELAEAMKEDLSQFMLGSMEEKDLKLMITQQAMLREKALILQLWPPSRLEPAWKSWLEGLDVSLYPGSLTVQPLHRRWIYRLVQALGSNAPANCPLPTVRIPGKESPKPAEDEHPDERDTGDNTLPPPFFVTNPALLIAQNYIQALVIAASLRSLVRLPLRSTHSPTENNAVSFTERIWTLLKASVDEEPGTDGTKIVNLADEVVHVRRACADPAHPCGQEEEERMRGAVDRTLKAHDPVFLLLQKRLLQGLAAWLVSAPSPSDGTRTPVDAASIRMQTGRERPGKRPRLRLGLDNPTSVFVGWERERGRPPAIKGFEDEVLVREVWETFKKVGAAVDWTERIWQDLVETGEVGGASEEDQAEQDDASASV